LPDNLIIAGDESQIEARLNACFCGQTDLVEEFRAGGDPYATQASLVYGYPVTKALKTERFVGKQLILMCGYGVGWRKYQGSIKHVSAEQTGTPIILSDQEAQRHVYGYRGSKPEIVKMWSYLNNVVIPAMTNPATNFMVGPVQILFEEIRLPNDLSLFYRNLHRSVKGDWWFTYGNRMKKIYGGKLLENIIQALARIVVMDVALDIRPAIKCLGGRLAMQVHDELVYVAPAAVAPMVKQIMETAMRIPPKWMPTVPLNCEVGIDVCYGKAH
jgi:DNA polymerase